MSGIVQGDWVEVQTDKGPRQVPAILVPPFAITPDGMYELRKGGWRFTFSVTHAASGFAVCPTLTEPKAFQLIAALMADPVVVAAFSKETTEEIRALPSETLGRIGAIIGKYRGWL